MNESTKTGNVCGILCTIGMFLLIIVLLVLPTIFKLLEVAK